MKQEAIYNIYPKVKRIVESNDGSLKTYDANEKIINVDMSKVSIKQKELESIYNSKAYQRDRAKEYPSKAIKDKHPKE